MELPPLTLQVQKYYNIPNREKLITEIFPQFILKILIKGVTCNIIVTIHPARGMVFPWL